MHTYIHTYIYTYIHTYIQTYIYTYIHTYVHTHVLNMHLCTQIYRFQPSDAAVRLPLTGIFLIFLPSVRLPSTGFSSPVAFEIRLRLFFFSGLVEDSLSSPSRPSTPGSGTILSLSLLSLERFARWRKDSSKVVLTLERPKNSLQSQRKRRTLVARDMSP